MRKKVLLIAFSFFIAVSSYSQDKLFSLGVRAGMNLSDMSVEHSDTKARVGYQFGIVGEYKLPNDFFLQSSLNVSSKGTKVDLDIDYDFNGDGIPDKGSVKTTWNATYLELPVLVGYKVNVTEGFGLKFMAGPYIAYGIGGKITGTASVDMGIPDGGYELYSGKDKMDSFSDESLKHFDFGLLGGVAADYQKFTITLGYEYGLSNVSQGSNGIHNRNAFLTIGYNFY